MITFTSGLDSRTRQANPCVAKLQIANNRFVFVVIGTAYGHIHTAGGDIRTWKSYSGARRFAKNYKPF